MAVSENHVMEPGSCCWADRLTSGGTLISMGSLEPHPPTLASLARVLPEYGKFRFDRTLEAARNDIGYHPDLADPEQARRLRTWLNKWAAGLDIRNPGRCVRRLSRDLVGQRQADLEFQLGG